MTTTPIRRSSGAAALAVGLAAALVLGGCSGEEQPDAPAAPTPSSQAADPAATPPPEVVTTVTVRHVTGRLAPQDRERLKARIGETVDDWFDAAYLGGSYPRRDFSDAFGSFTDVAADRARRDRRVMTNHDVGARVEAVRATARRVRLDVLAGRGRAAAVTARFVLGMELSGDVARRDRVRGSLDLVFDADAGGWRIFGYDVERGQVRD